MNENLLWVPRMLMIGSAGRNSGKTVLADALIRQWKSRQPVLALKVATVQELGGACVRGGKGCGLCSSLKDRFEIDAETDPTGDKDTNRLLAAGADQVYWLKAQKDYLREGTRELLAQITSDGIIICESNSLRNVVRPGYFIMIDNCGDAPWKKSARDVAEKADFILRSPVEESIPQILEKVNHDFGWVLDHLMKKQA
ncbi:hypothetical protein [Dehalobacterium formicoaceticum]|uniref:Uncharacterized protein n=1 Tax=Dehalobacterium formicoaceticum TaxID=51515 RepID=A0ABT1Y1V7_9FIRM|nr:hypothetical protein [Dehalobacterium formicoaceticum]MCR6544180.1 hypothetical protein [Dehalobacterium formicoaceticum]